MANRVRSILTVTGLVIGVTAVIAIQVLGAGMAGAVAGILGAVNDRTFVVVPNQQQTDFTRAAIRLEDLQRAKDQIANVVEAIPAGGQSQRASYGHVQRRVLLGAGVDERFATSTPIRYGRKLGYGRRRPVATRLRHLRSGIQELQDDRRSDRSSRCTSATTAIRSSACSAATRPGFCPSASTPT